MSNTDLDRIYKFLGSLDQTSIPAIIKIASELIQTTCPLLPNDIWKLIFTKANMFSNASLDHQTIYPIFHTISPMRLVCKEWAKIIEDIFTTYSHTNINSVKQLIYSAAISKNKLILNYALTRLDALTHSEGAFFTPLWERRSVVEAIWGIASDIGDPTLVKILLANNRLSSDRVDDHFKTIVILGHSDAFKTFLNDKYIRNWDVHNLIKFICERGHRNIILALMNYYKFPSDISINHVLVAVSKVGRVDIVRLLLCDHRIDPCFENARSLLVAMCVCEKNSHLDTVKVLLDDARIFKRSENKYLLFDAVQKGDLPLVKLLLGYSFTDIALHNNYAYHLAQLHDWPKIADYLLKQARITFCDIQPLIKNKTHIHAVDYSECGKKSDVFGIDSYGLTDVQIAEKVCSALGFKRPVSWETQKVGRRSNVSCVEYSDQYDEYRLFCYWDCTKDDRRFPLVFSLVCEL